MWHSITVILKYINMLFYNSNDEMQQCGIKAEFNHMVYFRVVYYNGIANLL